MINGLIFLLIILLSSLALINKQLSIRSHPFNIQFISSIFNVLLLPFWYSLIKKYSTFEPLDKLTIFYIIFGYILSTSGFLLLLFILKVKSLSVVVSYISVYPIFIAIVCSLLGQEKLTGMKIFGILLITCGIIVTQFGEK